MNGTKTFTLTATDDSPPITCLASDVFCSEQWISADGTIYFSVKKDSVKNNKISGEYKRENKIS